jgi:hypothetical protein
MASIAELVYRSRFVLHQFASTLVFGVCLFDLYSTL